MKIRTVAQTASFLALLLAGCTAPTGGPWPREGVVSPASAEPPAQAVAAENLSLTISTDRSRYALGEPIYLYLRVRNQAAQSRPAVSSLDPADGAVDLLITGPDGKQRPFRPLVRADVDASLQVELGPGEDIGGIAPIFFGADGWSFAAPGRYGLTAVYAVPKDGRISRAAAPAITIDIEASPLGTRLLGEDDAVRVEVGKFLTWQTGDHLERGQRRLRALLDAAPDSLLADYIHVAFARSLSEPFMDYQRGKVRPADCPRALRHLARVDLGRMPAYVRMQSALAGARCQLLVRNWQAAAGHLAEARSVKQGRPEFQDYGERLGRLEAYLKAAPEAAR